MGHLKRPPPFHFISAIQFVKTKRFREKLGRIGPIGEQMVQNGFGKRSDSKEL